MKISLKEQYTAKNISPPENFHVKNYGPTLPETDEWSQIQIFSTEYFFYVLPSLLCYLNTIYANNEKSKIGRRQHVSELYIWLTLYGLNDDHYTHPRYHNRIISHNWRSDFEQGCRMVQFSFYSTSCLITANQKYAVTIPTSMLTSQWVQLEALGISQAEWSFKTN